MFFDLRDRVRVCAVVVNVVYVDYPVVVFDRGGYYVASFHTHLVPFVRWNFLADERDCPCILRFSVVCRRVDRVPSW